MIKEISPKLLEIMACPLCKGELNYDRQNNELICEESKLAFKIQDGIPNMIIADAREL